MYDQLLSEQVAPSQVQQGEDPGHFRPDAGAEQGAHGPPDPGDRAHRGGALGRGAEDYLELMYPMITPDYEKKACCERGAEVVDHARKGGQGPGRHRQGRELAMEVMTNNPDSSAEYAILDLLGGDVEYQERFHRVSALSHRVRASEYQLTSACDLRCEGGWFFEHDFDKSTEALASIDEVRAFARRERERGITYAVMTGGEPTLVPDRIAAFVEVMDYVTISTNGLKRLPREGFENVAVQISLSGGGKLDDELRATEPEGPRFTGLFDQALRNYEGDPRACFVYAITEDGLDYIADTVRRIHENGNRVSFSFHGKYDQREPPRMQNARRLLDEALCVKELFPDTVLSHPYVIQTIVTGESHWGRFGHDECPSFSVDHPDNATRMANGNPYLPRFDAWAADRATVKFCPTSRHCEACHDGQAVLSWLLVSFDRFRESGDHMKTWIEISESYWKQFCWALYEAPTALIRRRPVLPMVASHA